MNRKDFFKTSGTLLLSGMCGGAAAGCAPKNGIEASGDVDFGSTKYPFPVYDLHSHRSDVQTAQQMVEKARQNGIEMFGILENVADYAIKNDDDLAKFIDEVKDYPCYIGLQPMETGWSANLSEELIDKVDYVVMDPQTIRNSNRYGDVAEVWEHDCYIPDAEEFMKINMQHYLDVINNPEPLDIFGWPLFLPPAIARDYHRHWTKERMEQIIEAVRRRGIALEINDLARTPHAEFILMAKKAGVKFTFGSDTRDHRTFRLDYCKQVASLCNLTEKDFFIPVKKKR